MAKPKQQLTSKLPKESSNPSGSEAELPGEDSWVVVKIQRVNILIPPLPANEQSTTPDAGPIQLQARPRKIIDMPSESPTATCQQMHPVGEREKTVSVAPNKGIPTARRSTRPVSTFPKLPRVGTTFPKLPGMGNIRTDSENRDQVDINRRCNAIGVRSSSTIRKRPLNFFSGGALLNQRMRASNLERKLHRAGGLSRWLESLGLDRFVKFFQGKRANKFQLVNLTMKKLKDMGADAVGPRRKLMHAIDCLCQPYCFEAL